MQELIYEKDKVIEQQAAKLEQLTQVNNSLSKLSHADMFLDAQSHGKGRNNLFRGTSNMMMSP